MFLPPYSFSFLQIFSTLYSCDGFFVIYGIDIFFFLPFLSWLNFSIHRQQINMFLLFCSFVFLQIFSTLYCCDRLLVICGIDTFSSLFMESTPVYLSRFLSYLNFSIQYQQISRTLLLYPFVFPQIFSTLSSCMTLQDPLRLLFPSKLTLFSLYPNYK